MKKIIALLSAILLVVSLSAAVFADDTVYTEGTLHYKVENESITIIGCFGKDAEVTVPAMIAGIPVNTIASGAFTGNKYIKKLNLPDTITVIQEDAIDPGISVIYNANTDHPQDTPTDLIKTRSAIDDPVVAPPESESENGPANSQPGESAPVQGDTAGQGQTPSDPSKDPEPSGPSADPSKDPGSSGDPVDPSAVTDNSATPIGGGDDDDDADDETAGNTDGTSDTADGTDVLPESGDATGPAETGKTPEGKTDGDGAGKGNGAGTLAWAIPCGVAGAGGITAAAILIGKKKKKAKDPAEPADNEEN